MEQDTNKPGRSFSETHYEEVFHIFAATAAMFGYPPPPPPSKLRKYGDSRNKNRNQVPDLEFYGYSPYERQMVRDEAHHAIRLLERRAQDSKRAGDKVGFAGLQYLVQTIKVFLSKVEFVDEGSEGLWGYIPIVNTIVRKRKEAKRKYENALKQAETRRMQSQGKGQPKKQPSFLDTKNENVLKAIYHTLRQYVLDENVDLQGSEQVTNALQKVQTFKVQKMTGTSASEAIDFNRWLGTFFSDLFKMH